MITFKAISKWKRWVSIPDASMLNSLEVIISELLNGEKGIKEEVDTESAINDAIQKYREVEKIKQGINL